MFHSPFRASSGCFPPTQGFAHSALLASLNEAYLTSLHPVPWPGLTGTLVTVPLTSVYYFRVSPTVFREKGFRFRDVDISKDPKAAQDVVRKTGQMGVPVVLINSKAIVGFNKAEIDRELQIKK